jgi:hypothetical protein
MTNAEFSNAERRMNVEALMIKARATFVIHPSFVI